MRKTFAVFAAALCAAADMFAATIDLSALTGDRTLQNGDIATGTLAGSYKIAIADGATVTLSNAVVNADGESSSGTKWAGLTCEGDAEIVLADDESVVTSFNGNYPGIYVPTNHTLTITGEGYLTVAGGNWSAGIGGGNGSDRGIDANCGSIVIHLEKGAWIDATGGAFSAGIGGGFDSACGDITIVGGGVFAYGGTGIGSGGRGAGGRGTCGDITIRGGDIEAEGDAGGAGIGSGNVGICGNITISGGSVMATGGTGAAGIGSGSGSGGETSAGCGNIAITGGEVEATGGAGAAGLGTGQGSYCYGVTIGGGIESVTATRGDAVTVGQQEYAGDPIGSGVDGDGEPVAIAPELDDETTPDGSTRTLSSSSWPEGSYEAWVREQGLTGADAEPDATPAKWGGRWANAFIYTFGEGLVDGTVALMSISFDADNKPIVTTAPVVEEHGDFTPIVVGASSLDDWDDVAELENADEQQPDRWTLAGDDTANFFRVRLEE